MRQYKASRRRLTAANPGFRCSDDAVRRDFGTQQIRQVLRVPVASSAYASSYSCIRELMTFLIRDRMVAVTLLNGARILKLILESHRRKTEIFFVNETTPTIFKVIFFSQCILVDSDELQKKTLTVS